MYFFQINITFLNWSKTVWQIFIIEKALYGVSGLSILIHALPPTSCMSSGKSCDFSASSQCTIQRISLVDL